MRTIAAGAMRWLLTLLAGPAMAASPYAESEWIASFDLGSYLWSSQGADIWPISWADDGNLYTAWGDGNLTCRDKASYGVAMSNSASPSADLVVRHCGPGPMNKGKMMGMIAVGDILYTRTNLQGSRGGHAIWRSTDQGATWDTRADQLPFVIDNFVQFGRGNQGAPGGYVYALESRNTSIYLLRVLAGSVQTGSAYQYFSGTTSSPAWSSKRSDAKPIFSDPAGLGRPTITYVPGLKRYVLAVAHTLSPETSGGNSLGLFDSTNYYGPWRTLYYSENHLGMRGGHYLGTNFPIKWQANDGTTLWATFSCHNKGDTDACRQYHDRFNVIKVTLSKRGGSVVNRPPIAVADAAQTEPGKAVVIPVLANDTDPDDHPLTITKRTVPPKGTATISGDKKSITYRPTSGFRGSDSFTYTVSDGRGGTALGSVAVTVGSGVPPSPVYLGCYSDVNGSDLSNPNHDLNGFVFRSAAMTVALCTTTCADRSFSYAGARNGFWCFCGNQYGRYGETKICTTSCAGNSAQKCGGYGANSVFDVNP